jgi:hypothetical protein
MVSDPKVRTQNADVGKVAVFPNRMPFFSEYLLQSRKGVDQRSNYLAEGTAA